MLTNRLKQCREQSGKRGLTKAQLARRIGVDRSYITKLEQGKAVPSLVTALRIGRYLGCPVEAIFELVTEVEGQA